MFRHTGKGVDYFRCKPTGEAWGLLFASSSANDTRSDRSIARRRRRIARSLSVGWQAERPARGYSAISPIFTLASALRAYGTRLSTNRRSTLSAGQFSLHLVASRARKPWINFLSVCPDICNECVGTSAISYIRRDRLRHD
jgi:hypothetical protein